MAHCINCGWEIPEELIEDLREEKTKEIICERCGQPLSKRVFNLKNKETKSVSQVQPVPRVKRKDSGQVPHQEPVMVKDLIKDTGRTIFRNMKASFNLIKEEVKKEFDKNFNEEKPNDRTKR